MNTKAIFNGLKQPSAYYFNRWRGLTAIWNLSNQERSLVSPGRRRAPPIGDHV